MYYSMVEKPIRLLKNPALFLDFYVTTAISLLHYKLTGRKRQYGKVFKRKIHTHQQANDLIYQGLVSDKPFAVMRNGSNESKFILIKEMLETGAVTGFPENILWKGKNNAGVFPPDEKTADLFAQCYSEANKEADITVFWGHITCEKYILNKFAPVAKLIPSRPLEPFAFEKPWTLALKGKKVLVIHPFAETIEKQYLKRDKLFERQVFLPEFELKTIKAVQSSADADCGFKSWAQALEYMKGEIEKTDFDIALLGCGAYAVPLAAYIKRMGKKAVVLGGFTQILFGIKGSRWEATRPDIVALYNDFWVRPDESEKPGGSEKVEENAYW